MDEKKILDLIEEAVDKMIELGSKPYAVICSRKTFEIVAKEMRKLGRFREFDNIIPLQMWIKYDFGDLPVFKFKYCPEDKVFVVDKNTYEQIMKGKDDNVFPDEIMMDKILKRYAELKKAKML